MEKKTINVDGHSFEMVQVSESEGYCFTNREYDLYFNGKRIAKDVGSIKSCYNKAFEYAQTLSS